MLLQNTESIAEWIKLIYPTIMWIQTSSTITDVMIIGIDTHCSHMLSAESVLKYQSPKDRQKIEEQIPRGHQIVGNVICSEHHNYNNKNYLMQLSAVPVVCLKWSCPVLGQSYSSMKCNLDTKSSRHELKRSVLKCQMWGQVDFKF